MGKSVAKVKRPKTSWMYGFSIISKKPQESYYKPSAMPDVRQRKRKNHLSI